MRLVNAGGRPALLVDDTVFDVAEASGGRLPPDPTAVVRHHWADLLDLQRRGTWSGGRPRREVALGPPVPEPRAVYAVGLNYAAHAAEAGRDAPPVPGIFTKFPTSVVGPHDDVVLPAGRTMVDWEVELTVVLGDGGRHVGRDGAPGAILGLMVGQDISERQLQFEAMGQFSMGKSFDTFCPTGPAVVTLDELADPWDLAIRCSVNGTEKQAARTSELLFDVPALVEFISSVCTLRAGDLLLTGTPEGVGVSRQPPEFLQPGDVVESEIEGLGTLTNRCVAEAGG